MKKNEIISHSEFYDKMWEGESNAWENCYEARNLRNAVIGYIDSIYESQRKYEILEVGCGRGALSVNLLKYGGLTALDLSPSVIKSNLSKYPEINFISGDFLLTELPDNHFDIVVSSEVIEHIELQKEFIEKIYRHLKTKGYLVLTTPNREICEKRHIYGGQPIEKHLNIKELDELLKNQFKIINHTTLNFSIGFPWLVKTVIKFPFLNTAIERFFVGKKFGAY